MGFMLLRTSYRIGTQLDKKWRAHREFIISFPMNQEMTSRCTWKGPSFGVYGIYKGIFIRIAFHIYATGLTRQQILKTLILATTYLPLIVIISPVEI